MAVKYNVIQKAYPGDPMAPKKFYANSIKKKMCAIPSTLSMRKD